MPGKAKAVSSGTALVRKVMKLGGELGMEVYPQYAVGRRLWGARRKIDVVLMDPKTRKMLGIECKYQSKQGSAEEKIPSTLQDIAAWPIPGIVVFAGGGFSANMRSFLLSTGRAVELDDLRDWLCLFFSLPQGSPRPV